MSDSINNEVLSITAVIETVAAMVLFSWWVFHFEHYRIPLLSAAAAFLLLLRSEESTRLGIKLFTAWERRGSRISETEEARTLRHRVLAHAFIIFAVCFTGISVLFVAPKVLTNVDGRDRIVGCLAIICAVIALAAALPVAIFGPGPGPGLRGGATAATIAIAKRKAGTLGEYAANIATLPVICGIAIAVFAVSLSIRFLTTVWCIRHGFRALPRNFRKLAVCTSPVQPPELIPGLGPELTQFTLRSIWHRLIEDWRSGDTWTLEYAYLASTALVWFFPGWFYRFTLKSTAWFWWMLALLGGPSRLSEDPGLFRLGVMETLWARLNIVLSLFTLVDFIFTKLVLTGAIWLGSPLPTALGYLFLIDWSQGLWRIPVLLATLLSLSIVFLVDHECRVYSHGKSTENHALIYQAQRHLIWIDSVRKVRLALVILSWVSVAIAVTVYLNSRACWFNFPAEGARTIQMIYGDRLPETLCSPSMSALQSDTY